MEQATQKCPYHKENQRRQSAKAFQRTLHFSDTGENSTTYYTHARTHAHTHTQKKCRCGN